MAGHVRFASLEHERVHDVSVEGDSLVIKNVVSLDPNVGGIVMEGMIPFICKNYYMNDIQVLILRYICALRYCCDIRHPSPGAVSIVTNENM